MPIKNAEQGDVDELRPEYDLSKLSGAVRGKYLKRPGMRNTVNVEPKIAHVEVTDEAITAHLVDGRVIRVPLAWSWRLSAATPAQRARWQLIGDGHGVHWPDVDEDISAEGMLHGR